MHAHSPPSPTLTYYPPPFHRALTLGEPSALSLRRTAPRDVESASSAPWLGSGLGLGLGSGLGLGLGLGLGVRGARVPQARVPRSDAHRGAEAAEVADGRVVQLLRPAVG